MTQRGTGTPPRPGVETGTVRRDEVKKEIRERTSGASLRAPFASDVLATVVELDRRMTADMDRSEMLESAGDAISRLFPARAIMIQVLERPSTLAPVYCSEAPLSSFTNPPLVALRLSGDEPEDEQRDRKATLEDAGIRPTDRYRTRFFEGGAGFDVPVIDRFELIGIISVEYETELAEPRHDHAIFGQLAVHLGVQLRNARLLKQSRYLRDYLSKLLEHANAVILVAGKDRELRVVNRALLTLTGMNREELIGRDMTEIIAPEDRPRFLPVLLDALRGVSTSNFEIRIPKHDGGQARIAVNTGSIRGEGGDVEAVICIGTDLTQVRQLEEQVVHAEKLATLGQLAAGVVHELNNPLTSISVYSEFLLKKATKRATESEKGQDKDARADAEKLGRIVDSADRILRFTRDLVNYARPSTEMPTPTTIEEVLEQSLVFCEHIVAQCGAVVTREYAAGNPRLLAVTSQLHQVFINLVTNACHAMPHGAGSLTVSSEVEPSGFVRVCIKDNGAGILPAQRSQIFEPFFTTKQAGAGTGLGLSIVRNIVKQHRGTIGVTSDIGEGTAFVVRLPLHTEV